MNEAHYKRVYRKAGWLSPVVLVDGRVMGIWSHKRRGRYLHFTVEPFGKMTPAVRDDIEVEVKDLARFMGEVNGTRIRVLIDFQKSNTASN